MIFSSVIYDGSWTGLLSVVFEIYERKLDTVKIFRNTECQSFLFGETLTVISDETKALRVWKGLARKLSSSGVRNIYCCFLSELTGIEDSIVSYIQLVFSTEDSVEKAFTYSSVLRLNQVGKMVHREKHRMEAFVRFKLTRDYIYYAKIEPDFNVLPLILQHFKNRYADQKWIIYDLKRSYGLYYDLNVVEEITFDFHQSVSQNENVFEESEIIYQNLWKDYFKNINIPSRKNTALHIKHIPLRYWKHLIEK